MGTHRDKSTDRKNGLHGEAWRNMVKHLEERSFNAALQILSSAKYPEFRHALLVDHYTDHDPNGRCLLEHFSSDENHDVFVWLLAQGAPPVNPAGRDAYFDSDGCITELLACKGAIRNLQHLVEREGPGILQLVGVHGESVMHQACRNFQLPVVAYLLELVPEQLTRPNKWGSPPLQHLSNLPKRQMLLDLVASWRAQTAAHQAIVELNDELKGARARPL